MDRRRLLIRFIPILIAVVAVAMQFMSSEKNTNEVGRTARVALSREQESQLGLQSYQKVLSETRQVTSGPEVEMVKRVAQRVEAAVGASGKGYQWQVSLVQDKQANAFCLPGGKIVVFTGILPITQTEGGLATVVGHEVAHATARHGSERMMKERATQTLLTGVSWSMVDMDYQNQRQIMAVLGAGAQYGLLLPWGRDQESEADHLGLLYLARAGYDPRESIGFWQRMEKVGGKSAPEWSSTHPSHGTRISQLKEWMPEALKLYEKSQRGEQQSREVPLER